jgi:type 1 fimbria pilin
MAYTVVFTGNLQWTPPSAPSGSGQSAFTVQASYSAHNVGTLDVHPGISPGTSISIPFGQVGAAKLVVVRNMSTADIDLSLGGSSDMVSISPQGMHVYASPVNLSDGDNFLSEASVTVLSSPSSTQQIHFWVFGD